MADKSLFYSRAKNGKRTLTKQGEAVLWYMKDVIGVKEITTDNWREVFGRIEKFEDKFGAIVVFWEDGEPIHNPIEPDEIESMVGLKLKEPELILDNEEWEKRLDKLVTTRDEETKRIASQYDDIPKEAEKIEDLAPGAEIHTQPIISMPDVGQGGK